MTNNELNNYIQHYLERDKTKSAIMLTGDWGTGKSYYIQNELIPFLQKNGKNNCVTVSLYALRAVSEISKEIYLDLRVKTLQSKGETVTTGMLLAKTVAKGVTSFLGIDLSSSEEEMQKLYQSIDLSGKLIILEDIERSQIDILEVLGYVNSLVEQDGAKVLLVANESEILRYDEIEETISENGENPLQTDNSSTYKGRKLTQKSLGYLATKEKSVKDTILFEGKPKTAVLQIIKEYDNPLLNQFANDASVTDICEIMTICKNNNLRSFIFACQKSVNIFEQMENIYETDFIQCIFFGALFFSLRLKTGKTMVWDGSENYSIQLGSEKYPLFKFCFNYIESQRLDVSQISIAEKAFIQRQLYDQYKTKSDPALKVLFCYYLNYEKDVQQAVQSISERLKNPEDISFYDYGSIALYLVTVKHLLGFDIESAKESLVNNLKGRGNELRLEELFRIALGEDESALIKEEYKNLRKEMDKALKTDTQIVPKFDYLPEQVGAFYNYVIKNYGQYYNKESFANDLDITRLADMFFACSPEQKQSLRGAFQAVYRTGNIKQFLANDISSLEELRNRIKLDMEQEIEDKVQKLQYEWFIRNLDDILHRLV